MPHATGPRLRVLHALRVKGFVSAELVAEASGLDQELVDGELAALADEQLARHRDGRVSGWMLTPDGRSTGKAMLAEELDEAGVRADVEQAYADFLEINQGFLSLCTDWQLREVDGEQVTNDHRDADYDAEVIGRLCAVDDAVQPICARLGAVLDRFANYGERFGKALAKVRDGEVDWFTKPMIESYHTVWFELHENLLATLNIDRATEGHT